MPILVMAAAIVLLFVAALIMGRCDIHQTLHRHQEQRKPLPPEDHPDRPKEQDPP